MFDVHSGPQVPEGKKSLAFSLRLRASDRTLTDEEIAKVRHEGVGAAPDLTRTRLLRCYGCPPPSVATLLVQRRQN